MEANELNRKIKSGLKVVIYTVYTFLKNQVMILHNIVKFIVDLILGEKYYANIVLTKGTVKTEICSFIFKTKEEAKKHKKDLETTLSFQYYETISFRSHKQY